MLVQVDSPRIALDLQRCDLVKKESLKLFCLPLSLDVRLDLIFGICKERWHSTQPWGRESGTELNLKIASQMLWNRENSFTWAYTYFSCHLCGYWANKCIATLAILGHFAQNMGSTSKTESCEKHSRTAASGCFLPGMVEHGSSEVPWMLTAGHCSTPKGNRVSDRGVALSLTCWPLKTCWDLKFCDNVRNRLGYKEEEKSNLGHWQSLFSKLFPAL